MLEENYYSMLHIFIVILLFNLLSELLFKTMYWKIRVLRPTTISATRDSQIIIMYSSLCTVIIISPPIWFQGTKSTRPVVVVLQCARPKIRPPRTKTNGKARKGEEKWFFHHPAAFSTVRRTASPFVLVVGSVGARHFVVSGTRFTRRKSNTNKTKKIKFNSFLSPMQRNTVLS